MRRSISVLVFLAGCATPVGNADTTPPSDSTSHPGCLLILDRSTGQIEESGSQSCDEPTTPASTYKIPHALMGLQAGVIPAPEAIRPWNEAAHPQAPWGREDQTLTTAIRKSVVWYFQEVAQELGPEKTQELLDAFDYGDRNIANRQTTYWLDSTLKVSPRQQLEFLRKLYGGELPVDPKHVEAVQQILAQPVGDLRARVPNPDAPNLQAAWTSRAKWAYKTGMSMHGDEPVTWLVGRAQRGAHDVLFVGRVVGGETDGSDSPAVEMVLEQVTARIDTRGG